MCAADLAPKPVPAEENGAPLLEAIWKDVGAYSAWKYGGFLRSGNLTLSDRQDLIRTEFARIKEGQNSPTPETQFASIAHVSREVADQIQACQNARQQVHDLAQLLRTQPDLLERLEAALRKPHFHFAIAYKSPTWSIHPLHLSKCRQTTNLLADFSLYYQALGEATKAQRCRLLLLRTPQLLNADFSEISSFVHCALTGIVIYNIGSQLPFLSEKELIDLQGAADKLQPWPKSWAEMMLNGRVTAVELIQLRGMHIDEAVTVLSNQDKWFWHIYFRSCFRYIDGLSCLNDYDIPINGKHIPLRNELSFMGGVLLPALNSIQAKWQIEAARIRQLRLGLALELIKRKTGRYPADLSAIELAKEDAEGKPMKYEVFGEGRGACLEFDNKTNAKTVHFGLGELPKNHPLGEASK